MDADTDVTSMRAVRSAAVQAEPRALIYAGWRDAPVDAPPEQVFAHIAEAVIGIGAAALELNGRLVVISHPRVFGGLAARWSEDDTPVPEDELGEAWLRGEQFALRTVPGRALVVRAGPVIPTKASEARSALASLGPVGVRRITPISDFDLGRAVRALVEAEATGVVHVAGPETSEREVWRGWTEVLGEPPLSEAGPVRPSWALRSGRGATVLDPVPAPTYGAEEASSASAPAPDREAPRSSGVRITTLWRGDLPVGEVRLHRDLSVVRLEAGQAFDVQPGQAVSVRSGKLVLEVEGDEDRVLRGGTRFETPRAARLVAVAATEAIIDRGRSG